MAYLAKCKDHKDCFANKKGECMSLKDTDFGDGMCPFYKNKNDISWKDIEKDCKEYEAMKGGAT